MHVRSLTFLTAALLIAACSVETPDAASDTASAIHGAGICATLDYPRALADADYYRQFESDAAAADYVTKLIANGELAGLLRSRIGGRPRSAAAHREGLRSGSALIPAGSAGFVDRSPRT